MGNPLSSVGWLGMGAGLMYMLDPECGSKRRGYVRDKVKMYADQVKREAQQLQEQAAQVTKMDVSGEVKAVQQELPRVALPRVSLPRVSSISLPKRAKRRESKRSPLTTIVMGLGTAALMVYGMRALDAGVRNRGATRRSAGTSRGMATGSSTGMSADLKTQGHAATQSGEERMDDALAPMDEAPLPQIEVTGISNVPAGQPAAPARDPNPADVVQGATSGQTPHRQM